MERIDFGKVAGQVDVKTLDESTRKQVIEVLDYLIDLKNSDLEIEAPLDILSHTASVICAAMVRTYGYNELKGMFYVNSKFGEEVVSEGLGRQFGSIYLQLIPINGEDPGIFLESDDPSREDVAKKTDRRTAHRLVALSSLDGLKPRPRKEVKV